MEELQKVITDLKSGNLSLKTIIRMVSEIYKGIK